MSEQETPQEGQQEPAEPITLSVPGTEPQEGQQEPAEPITLSVPGTEPQEGQETPQEPDEGQEGTGTEQDGDEDAQEPQEDAESFPRSYVEKLRRENADARARAKRADELAAALWEARVGALGKLADPTDLPFPEGADPLDPEAVTVAVDELLSRKPHLASRVPRGDVGQGASGPSEGFSLSSFIRSHA